MADKQYGVGVLGNCCTHGEFVAMALKQEPQAKIIADWETNLKGSRGLAIAIGLELARSAEELLDNPQIDIIAIACSPHEKAAWVEKAARAGKPIFLNKPMAESLNSTRKSEIKQFQLPMYDWGAIGIESLIKLRHNKMTSDKSIILPHRLVIRKSTAAPGEDH